MSPPIGAITTNGSQSWSSHLGRSWLRGGWLIECVGAGIGLQTQASPMQPAQSSQRGRPNRVFLLKSPRFPRHSVPRHDETSAIGLPYSVEALRCADLDLLYTNGDYAFCDRFPRAGRVVRQLERHVPPFLQTLLAVPQLARSDAILAMFESEAHASAALKLLRTPPFSRRPIAVISCWLAELLITASPRRRALYRLLYSNVDRLIFFSRNQLDIYHRELALPDHRLQFVPFGVDHIYFTPDPGQCVGREVLAVGRDRGRDWATLFKAVERTSVRVKLVCRESELIGLRVPSNVRVLGTVDRASYRALLAQAPVVVVPSRVCAYPTGQSVALEAMAMGRCCVITQTPALSDYLVPGQNSLAVPPNDPMALRDALQKAIDDEPLRTALGAGGRRCVEERFNAPAMWASVGAILREMVRADRI